MNKKIWITVALVLSMMCIAIGAFGEVQPGRSSVPTCTFVGYTAKPAAGNYGYTGAGSTCPPSAASRVTQSTTAATKTTSVTNTNCISIINPCPSNVSTPSSCKTTSTVTTTSAAAATVTSTAAKTATPTTITVPTSCGTITYYYSSPASCSYSISFR